MCLVLKLDNGKVVSIAHEQTHPVAHSNMDESATKLYYLVVLKDGEAEFHRSICFINYSIKVKFNPENLVVRTS